MSSIKTKKNGNFKKKFNISSNLKNLRKVTGTTFYKFHTATGIKENTLQKYEIEFKMPSLKNLIKIADFYSITLDFLLLYNKTKFPRSTKLHYLAEKIDKMNQVKRFQVESTASTLIGTKNLSTSIQIKIDNNNLKLTENIHQNIKILRENKNYTQKIVAESIGILLNQISCYERNAIPPADKLIKIANFFDVSIHVLATGVKINYSKIENKALREIIIKADNFLSFEDKEILIKIMQRIIEDVE